MKKTQNQKILEYLENGKSITNLEALLHLGCGRLASRICELRQQGHNIETRIVKTTGGASIARYSLKT